MELTGPIEWPIQVDDHEPAFFDLYYTELDGNRYVVATKGEVTKGEPLLRIESACIFGHVFRGVHCDCGDQFEAALSRVIEDGTGVIVFAMDEDARGHGVEMHFDLYVRRQHHGEMDEEKIFEEMGKDMDIREYEPVLEILRDLSVSSVRLMTNNPERLSVLSDSDIEVVDRIPLETEITEYNETLLLQEKEWMGYETSYKSLDEWADEFRARSKRGQIECMVTKGHADVVATGNVQNLRFDRFDDGFTTVFVTEDSEAAVQSRDTQEVDKLVVVGEDDWQEVESGKVPMEQKKQ